jgi:hypothetical protein
MAGVAKSPRKHSSWSFAVANTRSNEGLAKTRVASAGPGKTKYPLACVLAEAVVEKGLETV